MIAYSKYSMYSTYTFAVSVGRESWLMKQHQVCYGLMLCSDIIQHLYAMKAFTYRRSVRLKVKRWPCKWNREEAWALTQWSGSHVFVWQSHGSSSLLKELSEWNLELMFIVQRESRIPAPSCHRVTSKLCCYLTVTGLQTKDPIDLHEFINHDSLSLFKTY